jgi:hypothetical protein
MKLILSFFLFLFSLNFWAQNKNKYDIEGSFSIGVTDLDVEKRKTNNYLDLLNYADFDPDNIDDYILRMGLKFGNFKKFYTDINFVLQSDLVPDTYDVSLNMFYNKSIGLGVGSMRTYMYISSFEEFVLDKHPEYFLLDQNIRQYKLYNSGFYITPILKPINNNRLQIELKCDVGLAASSKDKFSFFLKRKYDNERLSYTYKTRKDIHLFINPKLNIKLRLFNLNKASVGFLLNTSYYYSKMNINCQRTTQKWTESNKKIIDFRSPGHKVKQYFIDVGVFIRI